MRSSSIKEWPQQNQSIFLIQGLRICSLLYAQSHTGGSVIIGELPAVGPAARTQLRDLRATRTHKPHVTTRESSLRGGGGVGGSKEMLCVTAPLHLSTTIKSASQNGVPNNLTGDGQSLMRAHTQPPVTPTGSLFDGRVWGGGRLGEHT